MKKIFFAILILGSWAAYSQPKTAGVIRYDFAEDYNKKIEKNKFLSEDEKNRQLQARKNFEAYVDPMQLTFNTEGFYYGKPDDARGSAWSKNEYWVRRDFENRTVLESQELNRKTHIVEDDIYTFPWKIKTEIKEVAGYMCMSATYYDSVANYEVKVWFTTEIPVAVGPEEFMGLPGAILEVNIDDGVYMVTATSVSLKDNQELPKLPKRIRGKRYTRKQYQEARAKVFKDAEVKKDMWVWVRY